MSNAPPEAEGATEMIFCKMQSEIGNFLRHCKAAGLWSWTNMEKPPAGSFAAIDQLDEICEQRFFKHCDPSIPLHLLTLAVGRSILLMLRLILRHPRQYGERARTPMAPDERQKVWDICVQILEYYNSCLKTESIQGYLWHVNVHFQWHAFIIITHELCLRTDTPEAEKGWTLLEGLFEHNSDVIMIRTTPIHKAVRRLVLKAWAAREAATAPQGTLNQQQFQTPHFVLILKSQAAAAAEKCDALLPPPPPPPPVVGAGNQPSSASDPRPQPPPAGEHTQNVHASVSGNGIEGMMMTTPEEATDFLTEPIDWAEWDNLLPGYEMQTS